MFPAMRPFHTGILGAHACVEAPVADLLTMPAWEFRVFLGEAEQKMSCQPDKHLYAETAQQLHQTRHRIRSHDVRPVLHRIVQPCLDLPGLLRGDAFLSILSIHVKSLYTCKI